jgi:hypothetical protein
MKASLHLQVHPNSLSLSLSLIDHGMQENLLLWRFLSEGYPNGTGNPTTGKKCCTRAKKKGDRGFIEGW